MTDWSKALEVFIVGLSGVFLVLVILMFCIVFFSRIIKLLPEKEAKK